jgi:coenzyme Q-binding protein COQ10
MTQFRNKRRVNHSAADMFDLVADIEKYPQFVPLCQSLRVRKRAEAEGGVVTLVADMTVAYKLIRETFVSRVTLDRPNMKIKVEYLDGPFSILDNRWTFTALSERSSEVEFFIAYEFKSRVLGMLMGAMFEAAFRRFAEAFERRADALYGRVSSS